jgi:hypothetical protein
MDTDAPYVISSTAVTMLEHLRGFWSDHRDATVKELTEEARAFNTGADPQWPQVFLDAAWIDRNLFDTPSFNTHWREPFHFPVENQIIDMDDETYIAVDVGVFTFRLLFVHCA